jgi:5-methylcytosine-specific restriction endonuclease McrA
MRTDTEEVEEEADEQLRGARMTAPVLVLNAGYEAVMTVSVRRAMVLIVEGKAEMVEQDAAAVIRSERCRWFAPLVIRLLRYIRVPHRMHGRMGRRMVLARDRYTCGYCGGDDGLTIDHITPRSQGGGNEWENVVACCLRCNQRKGNRTPEQADIRLRIRPRRPSIHDILCRGYREVPAQWQTYLAYAG